MKVDKDRFSLVELFQSSETEIDDRKRFMARQYQNLSNGKLELNPSLLGIIARRLGLEFLRNTPITGGEVCFAESPEVRDDFKTYFTAGDLLDYIQAVLAADRSNTPAAKDFWIPYPDPEHFWEWCRKV